MKKLACLLLALLWLCLLTAFAEEQPEWNYPIDPLTLRDLDQYLTLANRDCLLDSDYAPQDLVRVTAKHVSGQFQLRKEARTDPASACAYDGWNDLSACAGCAMAAACRKAQNAAAETEKDGDAK